MTTVDGRKVLRTTTRTHGMALTMYVMVFVLGVLHVMDLTSHSGMDNWIGIRNTNVWAMWHLPAGVMALGGAMVASFSNDPRAGTWIEFIGCSSIAAIKALYLVSLIRLSDGVLLSGALTTKVMALGLMTGALITMAQILWDQRKVRIAWRQGGVAAQEPLLAEPHTSGSETINQDI